MFKAPLMASQAAYLRKSIISQHKDWLSKAALHLLTTLSPHSSVHNHLLMFRLFFLNKAALSQFLSFLPFPQTSRAASAAVAGCSLVHSFALYGEMPWPGMSLYGIGQVLYWLGQKGEGLTGSLILSTNFPVGLPASLLHCCVGSRQKEFQGLPNISA